MILKFIREIILFLFVSGLSRLLPFLLTPIFTHYLAPLEMGRLELILSLYNIFMVFGIFQLDTGLQRYFFTSKSIPRIVVSNVIKLSVLVMLIFFALMPLFKSFLSLGNDAYLELSFAGAAILFSNLHVINSLIIRYDKPVKFVIIINVVQTTIFAILAYILIAKLNQGIKGYFLALLLSYMISTVISFPLIKDIFKVPVESSEIKRLWGFSFPQMPARIASVMAQYGNRFILYFVLSQSLIGVFAIANKVSTLMLLGLNAFTMVWYPLLYNKNKEKAIENAIRIFKVVISLMPLIVISLFIVTAVLFKYFIAGEYQSAEYPSYVMILASSMLIIKEMVDAGIKLSEKTIYISYIYVTNTIVLYVLILVCGYYWGLNGVAYSIFLSTSILTYSTWLVAEKIYPIKFSMKYCHGYIIFCLLCVFFLKKMM